MVGIYNKIKESKKYQITMKKIGVEDFYKGKLNSKRIARYKKLEEEYRTDINTIAAIFSEGIEFALEILNNELIEEVIYECQLCHKDSATYLYSLTGSDENNAHLIFDVFKCSECGETFTV